MANLTDWMPHPRINWAGMLGCSLTDFVYLRQRGESRKMIISGIMERAQIAAPLFFLDKDREKRLMKVVKVNVGARFSEYSRQSWARGL